MTTCKYLPWVVTLIGATVLLFGWFFNVHWLRSPNPKWFPSMKPITAMCFIASGIQLAALRKNLWTQATMSAGIIVGLLLGVVLPRWEDSLRAVDWDPDKFTISPYPVPSAATVLLFALLANVGIVESMWRENRTVLRVFTAMACFVVSISTFIGYILDVHWMFFYIPEVSTGVAPHTALCFLMLSFCLFPETLEKKK